MIKTFISMTLVGLLLMTGAASAQSERPEPELGSFLVTGTDASGDAFAGGVEFIHAEEQAPGLLVMNWQVPERWRGVGMIGDAGIAAGFGPAACDFALYNLEGNIVAQPEAISLEGLYLDPSDVIIHQQQAARPMIDGNTLTLELSGQQGERLYSGELRLTDAGETVAVELTMEDHTLSGTGIVVANLLAAAFGGPECAAAAYEAVAGGGLSGQWTTDGGGFVYPETVTPYTIVGEYAVAGSDFQDNDYEGVLTVGFEGAAHTFDWRIGDQVFTGVGMMRGGTVAAGFGGESCAAGIYVQTLVGNLQGYWVVPGESVQAFEFAERTAERWSAGGDLSGVYTISERTAHDGSMTTGALTLTALDRDALLYRLEWDLDDGRQISGIGLQLGTTLVYGFGGESCGVNAYYGAADSLNGLYSVVGAEAYGAEFAQR